MTVCSSGTYKNPPTCGCSAHAAISSCRTTPLGDTNEKLKRSLTCLRLLQEPAGGYEGSGPPSRLDFPHLLQAVKHACLFVLCSHFLSTRSTRSQTHNLGAVRLTTAPTCHCRKYIFKENFIHETLKRSKQPATNIHNTTSGAHTLS